MSKIRNNPRKKICFGDGREIFSSEAWLNLTGKSTQIYILLCFRKVLKILKIEGNTYYQIKNNGKIEFTYKVAKEKYGISNDQFRRGIDQLVKHGFIRVKPGYPLKYEIVDDWREYDPKDPDKFKRRKTTVLTRNKKLTENEKRERVNRFKKPYPYPKPKPKPLPSPSLSNSNSRDIKPIRRIKKIIRVANL